ncbi:hypothetical protein C7999DRAFT_36719, partial [Corynascus novoguineensis]
METQDALPLGGGPWDEFFASSILADIHETQPGAAIDLSGSGRAVAGTMEANNAGGEISAAPIGTHPVNDASLNGSCHPTGSFFSFNHDPPECYDLFATSDGNPFHEAHPDDKGPFASDGPLHDTPSINLCGTNVERLEQRLRSVERTVQHTYQKMDSIQKAMKKWSEVVNKSLLEIAKAVGIPLQYRDAEEEYRGIRHKTRGAATHKDDLEIRYGLRHENCTQGPASQTCLRDNAHANTPTVLG